MYIHMYTYLMHTFTYPMLTNVYAKTTERGKGGSRGNRSRVSSHSCEAPTKAEKDPQYYPFSIFSLADS